MFRKISESSSQELSGEDLKGKDFSHCDLSGTETLSVSVAHVAERCRLGLPWETQTQPPPRAIAETLMKSRARECLFVCVGCGLHVVRESVGIGHGELVDGLFPP